ncbi:MAG: 2-amino-4-hydroxy-6-hydroxymethyldihydropteridine diphosphokinase, partial [Planctomycetales bacterium]|nr:2-amino-4-hydroxy-6-hydroxymethyldihydropteridine diphosphokinase [Planctomycetales bacterium]
ARSIDLDLLLFDEHIVATADLIVPHPWLAVRRFALEPSRQIAPDMVHPGCGWSIARLAEHLDNSPRYVAVLSDEQSGNHRLDWNSSAWQDVAHHGYPHAHLQWIRNPHSQPRDSAAPSLDIPQALELLDQQVEVVKAVDAVGTCDPHQGTVPRGDWYISDFWIGCCGQHVRGSLDELAWFRSQVDAALMALPMPRLLIIATSSVWRAYAQWLAHGEVPGHRSSCWRSVNNHWRGPILFVAGDQDAIVQQLLAALSAME